MPLLELLSLSKSYGALKANDAVSLRVNRGEIHALLGENGAGKSTLVKMIYGIVPPDSGQILFENREIIENSPQLARKNGIGMVFQHFSLFDAMSVYENILLGLDFHVKPAEIETILKSYGLQLDLKAYVYTLSSGERQRIEIARALLQNPKLLILDEPTSVLTPQEAENLFIVLRKLASEGRSILYISHKLNEIKGLCSKATILRGGKVVANLDPRASSTDELAALMIGDELTSLKHITHDIGEERLQFRGISVKAGEILGVAGVAGNGQGDLLDELSGERPSSELYLKGEDISQKSPSQRRVLGLCCIPEERNGHASVPALSLVENTLITAQQRMKLTQNGLINSDKTRILADKIITKFNVKTQSAAALASSLSGGNLQKFIVGREILQNPDVLVVEQPTWGVDAGAAAHIRQSLLTLAENGTAIIIISQDLDELYELCDRLTVISNGVLSPVRALKDWTIEEVGLAMENAHA
jgi:general nucleoside transport system ATP-binding protein